MNTETGETPTEEILTEDQRQKNLKSVAELGGVDVETVKSVAEKLSAESGQAETGVKKGDKVELKIQGILVPDVKVIEIDVSTNVVTIQIGEKEPVAMAGDVFDVAYKQAQREKEVQAAVRGGQTA